MTRLMNLESRAIYDLKVSPAHVAELIELVDGGAISTTMAKTVLEEAFANGQLPSKIVDEKGYTQISDSTAVKTAVSEAIEANPKAVADYLGGKDTATKFLVGQVMKITRGQAKPDLVSQLVQEELDLLKARA